MTDRQKSAHRNSASARAASSPKNKRRGASAVEFAVVLPLIVAAMATGVFLLGARVHSAMEASAGSEFHVATSPSGAPRPTSVEVSDAIAGAFGVQMPEYAAILCIGLGGGLLAAGVLALGTLGLPYLRGVFSTLPNGDRHARSPLPDDVQARVFAKRQSLLRAFMADRGPVGEMALEMRHVMTRELVKVSPTKQLAALKEMIAEQGFRHLLVCDPMNGKLLGVVSDRDVLAGRGATAGALMTRDPFTVEPGMPLGLAMTYMIHAGISCLPVVEGEQLTGIFTTTDAMLTLQAVLQLWLKRELARDELPDFYDGWQRQSRQLGESLSRQKNRLNAMRERLQDMLASRDWGDAVTLADGAGKLVPLLSESVAELESLQNKLSGHARAIAETDSAQSRAALALATPRELEDSLKLLLALRHRTGQAISVIVFTFEHDDASASPSDNAMQPFLVRLHAALRDSDVIGRLRADALTVLMPGLPAQHAPAVLARLCIAVDDVAEQQGLVFHAGVATAEGGEEIAALFARAEAAALRFGIGSNEEFAHK